MAALVRWCCAYARGYFEAVEQQQQEWLERVRQLEQMHFATRLLLRRLLIVFHCSLLFRPLWDLF